MFKMKWYRLVIRGVERGDGLLRNRPSVLVMLIHLSGALATGAGGIWSRFINRAERVKFKENHPRVCYLYMEHSKCGTVSSLSFNYN